MKSPPDLLVEIATSHTDIAVAPTAAAESSAVLSNQHIPVLSIPPTLAIGSRVKLDPSETYSGIRKQDVDDWINHMELYCLIKERLPKYKQLSQAILLLKDATSVGGHEFLSFRPKILSFKNL